MTPRTPTENQRIRDERREQLLAAAAQVFARKGLAATKIADVAAAAGISHGLVYHYFPSKEELFTALVEQIMNGAVWVAQAASGQPGTPVERLHWMLSMMLMGMEQQPEFFLVMIQAVTSEAVPASARQMAMQQAAISRESVTQLIAEAQAAGELRQGSATHLALILLSAIQGFAIGMATGDSVTRDLPDAQTLIAILKP